MKKGQPQCGYKHHSSSTGSGDFNVEALLLSVPGHFQPYFYQIAHSMTPV